MRLSFNGFNHSAYLVDDPQLSDQIAAAAAAGFDAYGVDRFTVDAHVATGGNLAEVSGWLTAAGIDCAEVVPLPLSDDETVTLPVAERVAEIVAALGATHVLANGRSPVSARSAAVLARCTDLLAPLGVTIGIEYMPTTAIASIADARSLIAAAGVAGPVGVMVDTWHFFRGPDTWADLVSLPVDEIAFVQFCDAPPPESDDLHHEMLHRRVLPGEGELDLDRFCGVLADAGFDGLVSVEVLSERWRARPVGELAAAAYDATRRYWPA